MKHLAPSLWVPIIASLQPPVTGKGGLGHHAWHGLVVEVVVSARSTDSLSFQRSPGVSQPAALAEVETEGEQLKDELHHYHLPNFHKVTVMSQVILPLL